MARHRDANARRLRLPVLVVLVILLTLAGLGPPWAGPAAAQETATDRLRGFFGAVNRILADPALDDRPYERLGRVRELILDLVDFRAAAGAALGPAWQERSGPEREQFVPLFSELLQSSLLLRVRSRARLEGGLAVTYAAEVREPDGVTVPTWIATRAGDEFTVAFRMTRPGTRWMVRDAVVEGVSLIGNYRAQFQRLLQRQSFADLMAEMRGRLEATGSAIEVPVPPAPRIASATPAPLPAAPAPLPAAPVVVSPAPVPVLEPPASAPAVVRSASPLPSGVRTVPPVASVADTDHPRPAPVLPATGSAVAMVIPPLTLPLTPPVVAIPTPAATEPPRLPTATSEPSTPQGPAASPAVASARVADVASSAPEVDRVVVPAPATAAPGAAAAKAARPPGYWIQVGAFRGTDAAARVAAALRDQAITLVTTPGPSPLLRVLLGPFARRADALLTLRAVRARGFDGFLAAGPD
jgi:phospholipid transport system substrate-binding protein